jgi:hypothetical protein
MRKKSRKGKKRNVSNVVKEREYKKSLMGQISHCRSVLGAHKKGDDYYLRSNSGRVIRPH